MPLTPWGPLAPRCHTPTTCCFEKNLWNFMKICLPQQANHGSGEVRGPAHWGPHLPWPRAGRGQPAAPTVPAASRPRGEERSRRLPGFPEDSALAPSRPRLLSRVPGSRRSSPPRHSRDKADGRSHGTSLSPVLEGVLFGVQMCSPTLGAGRVRVTEPTGRGDGGVTRTGPEVSSLAGPLPRLPAPHAAGPPATCSSGAVPRSPEASSRPVLLPRRGSAGHRDVVQPSPQLREVSVCPSPSPLLLTFTKKQGHPTAHLSPQRHLKISLS